MLRAEECFSTQETAELLCVTREKVGWFRMYGLLPGTKTGRGYTFRLSSIRKFLDMTEGSDLSNRQKIILFAQKKGLVRACTSPERKASKSRQ